MPRDEDDEEEEYEGEWEAVENPDWDPDEHDVEPEHLWSEKGFADRAAAEEYARDIASGHATGGENSQQNEWYDHAVHSAYVYENDEGEWIVDVWGDRDVSP